MAEDNTQYEMEIQDLSRKLNLMSKQVQDYEGQLIDLRSENSVLTRKLQALEKDNQNIRNIMTNNITQSNAKEQALFAEIRDLKIALREAKDK